MAVPIASGGVVHGAVRITYPTSELDRRVRNYWLVLAGIAAVVLAAAALIGLRFARWIRRPLEGLELAAAEAGAGDLSARARRCRTAPPELRQLALEFNDMVARVEGLVSAQQEFVADASHELRTPLTALRLRLENLERHVGDGGRGSLDAAADEVGAPLRPRRRAARARPGGRRNGPGGDRRPRRGRRAIGSTRGSRLRGPFVSSSLPRDRCRRGPAPTGSRR